MAKTELEKGGEVMPLIAIPRKIAWATVRKSVLVISIKTVGLSRIEVYFFIVSADATSRYHGCERMWCEYGETSHKLPIISGALRHRICEICQRFTVGFFAVSDGLCKSLAFLYTFGGCRGRLGAVVRVGEK